MYKKIFLLILLGLIIIPISLAVTNYEINISTGNAQIISLSAATTIKGVANNGTDLFFNNNGGGITVAYFNGTIKYTSTIASIGTESGDMAYARGFLYVRNSGTSGNIYMLNLTTNTSTTVNIDSSKPLLTGDGWQNYNILDFPNGQIATVGSAATNPFTIRIYNISENGTSFTWDHDINISSSWSTDNHGFATDGNYLVLTSFLQGHRVYNISAGTQHSVNTWDIRPSGIGNPTFITHDHTNHRIIIGDYSDRDFMIFNETQLGDGTPPNIEYIPPTPQNATQTTNSSILTNITISETNLTNIIYQWNGTNYTFYDYTLLLYYNFNNISSLGENQTTITDISQYARASTLQGNTKPTTEGKYAGSLTFDGSSDYVNLGDTIIDNSTQLTIALWTKINDLSKDHAFLSKGEFNINVPILFWRDEATSSPCNAASDTIALLVSTGSADQRICASSGAYNDTDWHFMVGTFNASDTSGLNLYKDGIMIATPTSTASITKLESTSDELRIGAATPTSDTKDLNGSIDNFMIINRTLNAQEVYELYISSLAKINLTNWEVTINQSQNATTQLAKGNYTYQFFATDNANNTNSTALYAIEILLASTPTNISIISPINTTYTNNSILVNISNSSNTVSTWWSNGTTNTTYTTPLTANFTEGTHTLTAYTNNSNNDINTTQITFTIDLTPPTITILNPTNTTYYTPTITINISTNENSSAWYNINGETNISLTSNNSGTGFNGENTSINDGSYNITIYANDSYGNINSSSLIVTIYTIDSDNDGIIDNNDTLLGNSSSINAPGMNLTVTVSGNTTNGSFLGTQEVHILNNSNLILNFTHNFSTSNLNLNLISIIQQETSLIINLSDQLQGNKSVYFTDNDYVSICVKDSQVNSISEISTSCNQANETDFTNCIGNTTGITLNGINCIDNGTYYKFDNIRHSAFSGTQQNNDENSGGGGGGGSSSRGSTATIEETITEPLSCKSTWECTQWSFCSKDIIQTRTCTLKNLACTPEEKPITERPCPDILFDAILNITTKKISQNQPLVFLATITEVNQKELVDVELIYQIYQNEILVYEEKETRAVNHTLTYTKKISGLKLTEGGYNLKIIINYGKNQTASSLQPFIVRAINNKLLYVFISSVILFILIIFYKIYHKKREEKQVKAYLDSLGIEDLSKENIAEKEKNTTQKNPYHSQSLKEELEQDHQDNSSNP